MKKIKVLSLCLLFSGFSFFAQSNLKSIGVDIGPTYSVMSANVSNLVDSKYVGNYGWGVKFAGEYMVSKSLFFSTGMSYLEKNYEFTRTENRKGWYTRYNNDFLSFPLLIGGYFSNNNIWLKVAGGTYTEYWLKMKRDGQYPVFSELQIDGSNNYTKVSDTYDFDINENQLNRFGYGLQGQVQLGYSFKKFNIYGSYTYQQGLSNVNKGGKDKSQKISVHSYMVSLGTLYKFD